MIQKIVFKLVVFLTIFNLLFAQTFPFLVLAQEYDWGGDGGDAGGNPREEDVYRPVVNNEGTGDGPREEDYIQPAETIEPEVPQDTTPASSGYNPEADYAPLPAPNPEPDFYGGYYPQGRTDLPQTEPEPVVYNQYFADRSWNFGPANDAGSAGCDDTVNGCGADIGAVSQAVAQVIQYPPDPSVLTTPITYTFGSLNDLLIAQGDAQMQADLEKASQQAADEAKAQADADRKALEERLYGSASTGTLGDAVTSSIDQVKSIFNGLVNSFNSGEDTTVQLDPNLANSSCAWGYNSECLDKSKVETARVEALKSWEPPDVKSLAAADPTGLVMNAVKAAELTQLEAEVDRLRKEAGIKERLAADNQAKAVRRSALEELLEDQRLYPDGSLTPEERDARRLYIEKKKEYLASVNDVTADVTSWALITAATGLSGKAIVKSLAARVEKAAAKEVVAEVGRVAEPLVKVEPIVEGPEIFTVQNLGGKQGTFIEEVQGKRLIQRELSKDFTDVEYGEIQADYAKARKRLSTTDKLDDDVNADLLEIATQGSVQGVTVNGGSPWSYNRAYTRGLLMEVYSHDPALAGRIADDVFLGHGSKSGSLLGVLDDGIRPQGYLREKGSVISTGEHIFGGSSGGINQDNVSFADWTNQKILGRYSGLNPQPITAKGLREEIAQEKAMLAKLQQTEGASTASISGHSTYVDHLENTLAFLETPKAKASDVMLDALIRDNFPVIYFTKMNEEVVQALDNIPRRGMRGEFALPGGISPDSISTILVPKDKVELVQGLVKQKELDIAVFPRESFIYE